MPISHLLEDFGSPSFQAQSNGTTELLKEEQRLEAFEQGYKAGWDDASKAQSDSASQISAEFARNLQDLSFTYHEAFAHVMKAMNPLLQQVVEAVLPSLAHQTLGAQVVEQLMELARANGEQPASITVAPENRAAIENILEQEMPFPVDVKEDPAMGEGQVDLRFGQTEQAIELDDVLAGIGQAVAGFFQQHEKEMKHG